MGEHVGKYVLQRQLGRGGVAQVFAATTSGPGGFAKEVAVKRLLPAIATSPDFVARFLDEARLAARFAHPNIVQVFDCGIDAGSYFVAMELVRGASLAQLLEACVRNDVLPTPEAAVAIILGVCEGLDYAHRFCDEAGRPLNVVHRDVNPPNIMISSDGVVKLVDFGIAKAATNLYRTRTLSLHGKAGYMSPEQIAQNVRLDARSDVFSAGVVLFELLTGRLPFSGTTVHDQMRAVLEDAMPDPRQWRPSLPPDLLAVLQRALRKARDQRYPSAKAMGADLQAFLTRRNEPNPRQTIVDLITSSQLNAATGASSPKPGHSPQQPRPPNATDAPQAYDTAALPSSRAAPRLHDPTAPWDAATLRGVEEPTAVAPAPQPPRAHQLQIIALVAVALGVGLVLTWLLVVRTQTPRTTHPVEVPVSRIAQSLPPQAATHNPARAAKQPAPTSPQAPPTSVQPVRSPEPTPSPRAAAGHAVAGAPRAASTPHSATRAAPPPSRSLTALLQRPTNIQRSTSRVAKSAGRRRPAIKETTTAPLTVDSRPWTHVFVDGVSYGTTPITKPIVLPAGSHELVLRNDELGIDVHEELHMVAHRAVVVRRRIAKGTLWLRVDAGCGTIRVDSVTEGSAPLNEKLSLYEGRHTVRATCVPQGRRINIAAHEATTVVLVP